MKQVCPISNEYKECWVCVELGKQSRSEKKDTSNTIVEVKTFFYQKPVPNRSLLA